jgi:oligopeptide transport system substrate-binding protein
LNATRFAYAIKRNINPKTAGSFARLTDAIKGAPEWRGVDLDKAKPEDLKKLEAAVDASLQALDASGKPCKTGKDGYAQEDCLTLKLTFSKPAPYFHTIMGTWVAYPVKEESITAGKEIWWTSSKYQIGNGPFILKSVEPYIRARFEPNPNYWGGQARYAVEYSYVTDSVAALQAYKNNEFDIVSLEMPEDLEMVKADNLSGEILSSPVCTYAVMFHQQKEPFTDPNVRKAFAIALDRDAWVRDVLHGLGSPTLTWIPKGYPGYQEGEKRWGYNPDEAKKALAASKYGSAAKLPPITLTFSDKPGTRPLYEWLAKKWKEVLDVDINLNPVDSNAYASLVKDTKTAPQIYIFGWCADYPDPQSWLSVFWRSDTESAKRIAYVNPEFDKLTSQADVSADPKTRMELYQKAQDRLVADAPAAFMWNKVNSYLVKPWVKGIQMTPQDSGWPGIQVPLSVDIDTVTLP